MKLDYAFQIHFFKLALDGDPGTSPTPAIQVTTSPRFVTDKQYDKTKKLAAPTTANSASSRASDFRFGLGPPRPARGPAVGV